MAFSLQSIAQRLISGEETEEEVFSSPQKIALQLINNGRISAREELNIPESEPLRFNRIEPIQEETPDPQFGGLAPEFKDTTPIKDKMADFAKSIIGIPEDSKVTLFPKPEEELEFGQTNVFAIPTNLEEIHEIFKPAIAYLGAGVTIPANIIEGVAKDISGGSSTENFNAIRRILAGNPQEGDEIFVGDLLKGAGLTDESLRLPEGTIDRIGLIGDFIAFAKLDRLIQFVGRVTTSKNPTETFLKEVEDVARVGREFITQTAGTVPKPLKETAQEIIAFGGRFREETGAIGLGVGEGGEVAPTFFSRIIKEADALSGEKFNAKDVASIRKVMRKVKQPDGTKKLVEMEEASGILGKKVKPEEIKWSGIEDFLKDKKSVTKQEIQDYLRLNEVKVEEVMLKATKFGDQPSLQVPGGSNYQELLLKLPEIQTKRKAEINKEMDRLAEKFARQKTDSSAQKAVKQEMLKLEAEEQLIKKQQFTAGHFPDPNILSHVRLNERTSVKNEKVGFLEEIQSDWAQLGRKSGFIGKEKDAPAGFHFRQNTKSHPTAVLHELIEDSTGKIVGSGILKEQALQKAGFNTSRFVPNAPLLKNWWEFTLKRMLREGVNRGWDRMAWITGKQTADRYDLAKYAKKIEFTKSTDGTIRMNIDAIDGTKAVEIAKNMDDLEKHVGKEIRKRVEDGFAENKSVVSWETKGEGRFKQVDAKYVDTDGRYVSTTAIVRNLGKWRVIPRLSSSPQKDFDSLLDAKRYWEESSPVGGITTTLEGENLHVGGQWAFNLYDRTIPQFLNKFGEQFGARVEKVGIQQPQSGFPYKIVDQEGNHFNSYAGLRQAKEELIDLNSNDPSVISKTELGRFKRPFVMFEEEFKPQQYQSIPITDAMKKVALEEGFELFSAVGAGAGALALLSADAEAGEAEAGIISDTAKKILGLPKKLDPLRAFPEKAVDKAKLGFRVKELIKDRVFNINKAFLDSEVFVVEFEKNLSVLEREALPFIRQGMDNPNTLKKIGREDLIDIIRNPSDKLREFNDKLGKYYDDAHKMLADNFDSVGFVDNYVTQLWDIPKARKSDVVNYFTTRNPFVKKRTIPSLEAGINLGLKPKTLDIAELIRIYDQFKVKTIFNKQFAEGLNLLTDSETGLKAIMRFDKAPEGWITVDHPALNRAMAVGQTQVKVKARSIKQIIFQTIRQIKTIERTIAGGIVKPSENKPIQALEGVITNALTSRGMTEGEANAALNRLKAVYAGAEKVTGEIGEKISEKQVKDIKVIIEDIEAKVPVKVPLLSKVPVKVNPEIASEVRAVFSTPFKSPVINALETINAFTKKSMLSFSFFHHFALTESAFSSGLGIKALRLWNPYKVIKALKNKDFEIFKQMPLAKDSIEHGVKYGSLPDFQVARVREGLLSIERVTKNIPLIGRGTKLGREANDLWDRFLWDYYHNTLKLYAYEKSMVPALKRAEKISQKQYGRSLNAEEIKAVKNEIGLFVNDSFGGQQWELQRFFNDVRNRQMIHWLLLSPDWTFSVLKQAFAPIKGHRKAVAGGSIERKLAGTVLSKRAQLFWAKAIIYYNVVAQMANYTNTLRHTGTGRFTFDNAPGHKLDIFAGFNEDGTERYIRMGKQFREVAEWSYEPEKKLGAKLSPVLRAIMVQFSKSDPGSGFPTKFRDLPFYESLPERGKALAKSFLPFSLRSLVEEHSLQPFAFALPTSRGMTNAKTIREYKHAIKKGDIPRIIEISVAALRNNLDADQLFISANSFLKAEATKDRKVGAQKILDVLNKYDIKDRKLMEQYYINQGIITPEIQKIWADMKEKRQRIKTQRELILGIR